MKVEKCAGTNVDGTPCSAQPRPGKPTCIWHDPEAKAQRSEWSARGGSARSNKSRAAKTLPAAILTTDELISWLSLVFRQTIGGQLTPGIATATATVAKTIIEIGKVALVEERLAELERALQLEPPNRRSSRT